MSERKGPAPKAPAHTMGGGPRGPRGMGPRQPLDKKALKRLLGYLKPYWPRLLLVLVCIILNAVATARAATFLGTVIDRYITPMLGQENPDFSGLLSAIILMAALYALAIIATYSQARLMAVISQSVLRKVRDEMFDHTAEVTEYRATLPFPAASGPHTAPRRNGSCGRFEKRSAGHPVSGRFCA